MSTTDKPKRGPGRPKKPDCEQLSAGVHTSMTPGEYAQVETLADRDDMTVAAWARMVLREALAVSGGEE